jgi:hypothetical protein
LIKLILNLILHKTQLKSRHELTNHYDNS